jgi:hypothetical protein
MEKRYWNRTSRGRHISDHLIDKGINSYDKFENHIKDIEEDFWQRRFKVYAQWRKRQVESIVRKAISRCIRYLFVVEL